MGYAQYVGRIGALAVALGVTGAIGHTPQAWAEESTATGSSTTGGGENQPGTPDNPKPSPDPSQDAAGPDAPADTGAGGGAETNDGDDVGVVDAPEIEAPPGEEPADEDSPDPTQEPEPGTPAPPSAEQDPDEQQPGDASTPEVTETAAAEDPTGGGHAKPEGAPPVSGAEAAGAPDKDQQFVAQALTVSGLPESSLAEPLEVALAAPVATSLVTARSIAAVSEPPTATQESSVSITAVTPASVDESHPWRSLVLGVLGFFGFDPTPGASNDALLTALWAAYRGYERRFENETPTVSGATVVSTSLTEDGHTAVRLAIGFSDADGDTLHFTTTNGHAGTLTANADGTFTYLTTGSGEDTVTITANDDDGSHLHGLLGWLFKPNAGHTVTVTLALDVASAVNSAPVAVDDTATTNEDTPIVIHVLANDTDAENDPLSVDSFTQGAHGGLTLNADGTFTYAPDENYYGTDEFTYTATDGLKTSSTATVTITVAPVNDAPTFDPAAAITTLAAATDGPAKIVFSPDGSHVYTVLTAHYDDTQSDSYSLAVIDATTNGFTTIPLSGFIDANSLTVSRDGTRVFAYGASYDETSTYFLTVFDTASNTVGTIPFPGYVYNPLLGITVSPDGSHVYLSSLDSTTYRYMANVFDPAAKSVISVTLPAHFYPNTPTFNADGSEVYLPAGGDYTTGYQQTLSQIDSGTGAINTLNLPGSPQTLTFSSDGTRAYATFVSNSNCDDGNCRLAVIDTATMTTTWITIPAISRTMVISTDNRYVYATASDDTLMVVDTATNAVTNILLGGSVSAEYRLAVAPDGKTAYAVTGSGQFSNYHWQDHSLEIVDLTNHTVTAIPLADDPNQLPVSPDGTFVYLNDNDPDTGHSAVLLIDTATNTPTYVPTDGQGSWLTISANSRRLVEVRFVDSGEGPVSTLVEIDTAAKVANAIPLPGSVGSNALSPDGHHLYAWSGDNDDTYSLIRVSLGVGITVSRPDQASGIVTGTLHATDADGDHLIYALTTDASQGTATVHSDGTFTYAPTPEARHNAAAGGATTDTFTVTVVDGHGGSASTSVTVTVAPEVVAPPQVGADTAVTDEDTPVTIAVLANDTGSGALSVTAVSQPDHGSTFLNPNGTVTYTPATDFNGEDTFTYAVTDGTTPSQGAVNVTVNPVDDAPVIQSVVTTALSTTSWRITVTAYDPDGDPLDITLTPADAEHVTITPEVNLLSARMFSLAAFDAGPEPTTANYIAEVDPDYARSHPGEAVGATVGVTDGNSPTVTQQQQVATITNMLGFGDRNGFGIVDIPAAPDGLSYTKIVVGMVNSVALLSDGTAALYGINGDGFFEIPALPENITYTDAAYSDFTLFLLRSDGSLITAGTPDPLSRIPAAPDGVTYTGIVSTVQYTALLRSDGAVTVANLNASDASGAEVLTAGDDLTYTQAAIAGDHVVLLRSNGTAVAYTAPGAFGTPNSYGQLNIPDLPGGMTYTQVAGGDGFTVLLRSDGTVLTFGKKDSDYTDLPPLPPGMTYTAIAAGNTSALALRSDGAVVNFGNNIGQIAIPDLPAAVVYTHIYAGLDGAGVAATGHTTGLSASPDQIAINEDTQATVAVLANDVDPNGIPLTITGVTQGYHGTTAVNADGTITYTPAADYYGADTFAYTLSNGVTSTVAGVTVKVASQPDAPRAQDAVYEVAAGSVLHVNMADKVYDPPDPLVFPYDGRPQLEIASPPSLGSAEFTNLTYLTYTAPTDLGGATSTTFTYYGSDVWSHGNIAAVTINFV